MQIKMPKFQLAHLGSVVQVSFKSCLLHESGKFCRNIRLFFLQSAQLLFPSSFNRLLMVCAFLAARSAAGSGALRDMLKKLSLMYSEW